MSLDRVDPSDSANDAIRCASQQGHTEIVKLLLTDPRVDPSALNNEAIRLASRYGRYETVELLLSLDSKYKIDPAAANQQSIRHACEVRHSLKEPNNAGRLVQLLLADRRVDPTVNQSEAFWKAADRGNLEIVKALLEDGRVTGHFLAALAAASNGHAEVVELLMKDEQVRKEASESSNILCRAATGGHINVLGVLLGYPIQISHAHRALEKSAERGKLNAVEYLLSHSRLQDLDVTYSTLASAVGSGNEEMVRFLLAHPRLYVRKDAWVLSNAVYEGYLSIVKILLEDGRCNDANDNSDSVQEAARTGSLDMLQALIDGLSWRNEKDKREMFERSLFDASREGHLNIVEYLVNKQQGVCDTAAVCEKAAGIAFWYEHMAIVKFFEDRGYLPSAVYLEKLE
ncbi:ankyrin repeat-containing domain protein [Obelidium mucronatum]|nr:ankyrin repeat-containing domain protein [Obelidium mucronatum]